MTAKTTREIFGLDYDPKIETRTPEDLGYKKSPTSAERKKWREKNAGAGSGQAAA